MKPWIALALLVSFLPVACRGPAPPPTPGVALAPLSFDQWQQKLAGYKGEIVVVDLWATWCAPCLERFPHTVDLYRKYRAHGVRVVSLNLDDRTDAPALTRALDFLVKQGAVFENYRLDEAIPDAFEKLDLSGIPAVLIYGRDGSLKHRLTGDNPAAQFKDEDVDRAIEDLLGSRS